MATGRMRQFDLILAVSVLTVVLGITVWRIWFPGRAFDAAAWKDETKINQGVRSEMADRLVARGVLQGKTRQEIVDLLGEPLPPNSFGDWDIVYWLGYDGGYMGVDSWYLVLRLSDGRVQECRIVPD
jgi:hypothetical protein